MAAKMRRAVALHPNAGRTRLRLLSVLLVDEGRKGVDKLLQDLLQRFLAELALVVERIANPVQIGFRLSHDRARNARHDILQLFCRVDAAERPRRGADDADRLAPGTACSI